MTCVYVYVCVVNKTWDMRMRREIWLHTLQHTATHCSILPYTATHCNVLRHRGMQMRREIWQGFTMVWRVSTPTLISLWAGSRCVAVCCSVWQCAAVCCSVWWVSTPALILLHELAQGVWCSALLQCVVAVWCCSFLMQCLAVWRVSTSITLWAPSYTLTCNTLQHTATHCYALQHNATQCIRATRSLATHCNTLQHTATHCDTLRHNTHELHIPLRHTATHFRTLQHTAAHCNTLRHTVLPHSEQNNQYICKK